MTAAMVTDIPLQIALSIRIMEETACLKRKPHWFLSFRDRTRTSTARRSIKLGLPDQDLYFYVGRRKYIHRCTRA